jgi:NitT/TauT family transport system ATP-binding protein
MMGVARADSFVELQQVTLNYGRGTNAVEALGATNLRIAKGEFVALVGPSGRGQFRSKRKTEFRDRVEELLEQVGLAGFGAKYPWQLSGGMVQRASLCRALIHEPELLMLDEPFGALDQFTREELWAVLQDLWLSRRPTVLLVTHDLKEAGFLASRICVMRARPGHIVEDFHLPFPRPRTVEMTYAPDFVMMTQRLRELIVGGRLQRSQPQ